MKLRKQDVFGWILFVFITLLITTMIWKMSLNSGFASSNSGDEAFQGATLQEVQEIITQCPPDGGGSGGGFPALFVGNNVVDLKYDPPIQDYDFIEIMRNGESIAQLPKDELWYRDENVSKGEENLYQICFCKNDGSCYPSYEEETVLVGKVQGFIYKSLTWFGATYEVYSNVYVVNTDTVLEISPGTEVINGSSSPHGGEIKTYPYYGNGPGKIKIDGATIGIPVWFWNPGHSISATSIITGGSLTLRSDHEISGNSFINAPIILDPYDQPSGTYIINNNDFEKANISTYTNRNIPIDFTFENNFGDIEIEIEYQNKATIKNNLFLSPSRIYVTGSEPVTIQENHFIQSGPNLLDTPLIRIDSDANTLIEGNILEFIGESGIAYGIAIGDAGQTVPNVTIRENVISGFTEVGIAGFSKGIDQITENTIINNGAGISITGDGDSLINNNCIADNDSDGDYGLAIFSRTELLDATENYWGHESGPTHPDNPEGIGERIVGGPVDFSGYLSTHNCSSIDYKIAGIEAVQSIQTINNNVPLIEGKPTMVRIYPTSGGKSPMNVPFNLKIYRESALIDEYSGILPTIQFTDIDELRAEKTKSFNLRLYDDFLNGSLTLRIEINPDQSIPELNTENNVYTQTIEFNPVSQLDFAYLPFSIDVPNDSGGYDYYAASIPAIMDMHSFLVKTAPIPQNDYTILPKFHHRGDMEYNRMTFLMHLGSVYNALKSRGTIYKPFAGVSPRNLDQRVTFYPIGTNNFFFVTKDDVNTYASTYGAGNGLSREYDEINQFGYDLIQDEVIPKDYQVFMHPHPSAIKWISPFEFKAIFNKLKAPDTSKNSTPATRTYLLFSGVVHIDNQVEFEPIWEVTASEPPILPPNGDDYCVDLLDSSESVLDSHCFDLEFVDPLTGDVLDMQYFAVSLFKNPVGKYILLRKNSTELGRVSASDTLPQVTLTSPTGEGPFTGNLEVAWSGSDLDGDDLHYNLLYSPDDGSIWYPVAINLTDTMTTLDLDWVMGSSQARLRVEVSDGFHCSSDESSSIFVVDDKNPWVTISHPQEGAVIQGMMTNLSGSGVDLEDGSLSDSSLVWTSDIDGVLGEGNLLWDVSLSGGLHQITLTATDSQHNTASETISIMVVPERVIFLPLIMQ